MRFKLLLATFTLCIYSCSPVRYVKPLEKKQHAATVALGGPLISYGAATIPIPFITANYGYGIDSSLTGFASANITSALYGNAQVELGITKQLIKQKLYIPGVSVTPVANIIYRNKDAHKLYPQLAVNAFWEYGKRKNFIYLSCDNWFGLSKKRAFNVEQTNHWIVMPSLGHSLVGKKWNFSIEAKMIAPNLSNQKLVVDYKTPFHEHGAFGVYLGYTYKFN
jgi:hypothetical protein